jgi:hypothetical protein
MPLVGLRLLTTTGQNSMSLFWGLSTKMLFISLPIRHGKPTTGMEHWMKAKWQIPNYFLFL